MDSQEKPPKDIRVELRFKNNLILSLMEKDGYKTVAELSRAVGISQSQLGELVNMQELPMTKGGVWRAAVLKLADFFGCLPEDLFSDFQRESALSKNRAHAEMHFGEIQAMLAEERARLLEPSTIAEAHELAAVLEAGMSALNRREQEVLRARFGFDGKELTLEETGERMGLTKERVRQIEQKALRRLRHPHYSDLIREAAGIEDD